MLLQHFQFDNKAPPKAQKRKYFSLLPKARKKRAKKKIIAEAVDAIVTLSKAITHPETVVTIAQLASNTAKTRF